jgi:hypothetical protein
MPHLNPILPIKKLKLKDNRSDSKSEDFTCLNEEKPIDTGLQN